MAIDRTGISSLQAGAGEIPYTGNQGPRSPDQQLMASADPMLVDEYNKYVFQMEEQGLQPISFRQFVEQIMSESRQGGAYGGTAKPTYTQSRKQSLAYGGIAGVDGRKRYGIGSWFQEAKDKIFDDLIPNEIKENPYLSAAVAGGLLNQFGLPDIIPGEMSTKGMGQNWLGELLSKVPGTGEGTIDMVLGGERGADQIGLGEGIRNIGASLGIVPNKTPDIKQSKIDELTGGGINPADPSTWEKTNQLLTSTELSPFRKALATVLPGGDPGYVEGGLYNKLLGIGTGTGTGTGQGINWQTPLAVGLGIGALDKATRKDETLPAQPGIDIANIRSRALTGSDPNLHFLPPASATTAYAQGGRIGYDNGGDVMMASNPSMGDELNQMSLMIFKKPLSELTDDEYEDLQEFIREKSAKGGRIRAQEGGLMDLGGMEKDYREEGGFVPIGGQERADDVPARLSKNEFVFTADAVRSAGGGDIDRGAEVMENVMKNLEQGGQISQESQGLEGARNMFATAQRLEGVM